jgi:carbon monoxide dehydrogenase subunit G
MQLNGEQIFNAVPTKVWEMLMDPNTLIKVVPGISALEKLSENAFKSISNIKIGPVSGSFTGTLQLEEIVNEKSFTLKAQQNSKIGNGNAAIKIILEPINGNSTNVSFIGDVKLSGILATMGQRIIGGVANTLTKQFFNNLEKEIAAKENAHVNKIQIS